MIYFGTINAPSGNFPCFEVLIELIAQVCKGEHRGSPINNESCDLPFKPQAFNCGNSGGIKGNPRYVLDLNATLVDPKFTSILCTWSLEAPDINRLDYFLLVVDMLACKGLQDVVQIFKGPSRTINLR